MFSVFVVVFFSQYSAVFFTFFITFMNFPEVSSFYGLLCQGFHNLHVVSYFSLTTSTPTSAATTYYDDDDDDYYYYYYEDVNEISCFFMLALVLAHIRVSTKVCF